MNADKDIKDMLQKSDAAAHYDEAKEGFMRDVLVSSFKGRMRAATIIAYATILPFAAIAVYAAVQFFLADQVRDMIMYATIFATSISVVLVTKLWYWMLANRNGIQRELKRLELRLAEKGSGSAVE